MISISIITRFYCINFEFSVPRLNWLGTYLGPTQKGSFIFFVVGPAFFFVAHPRLSITPAFSAVVTHTHSF